MRTTKLLTTIVLIVLALSACKKSTDELTSVIPAEATTLVYIDTKSLIDKSNYDLFKNDAVKEALEYASQLWAENEDAQKLLKEFVERDINVLGVDLKGDMLVFTLEDITGVVLKVNDASRMRKVITSVFKLPEDEIVVIDGINTFSPNSDVNIAWDNNRMLILIPQNRYYWKESRDKIEPNMIAGLFKLKSDKSINSQVGFAQFMENKKDISVYTSLNNEVIRGISGILGESEFLQYKDQVKGFTNILFEKGAINSTSEVYFANDTVKTKFENQVNKIVKPIRGDAMKFISANPMIMLCVGLNGEGVSKLIQESRMFSTRDKEELTSIFSKFNGDVLYYLDDITMTNSTVYGYEYQGSKLQMGTLAETTQGKELVNRFLELDSYTKYHQISENVYQTETEINDTICVGYKDNYFFFSFNSSSLGKFEGKNDIGDSAKGKLFYLKGSNKGLFNLMNEKSSLSPIQRSIMKNAIELLQSYELSVDKQFNLQSRLELRDKDKNSMEIISLCIDDIINSSGDISRIFLEKYE